MRISLVVLLLVFVVDVSRAESNDRICLWQLQTAKTNMYLLGSIHALKKEMYPLPAAIRRAYRNAETIVFEVDLTRVQPYEMGQFIDEQGRYSDNTTLAQSLEPDTYQLLQQHLGSAGFDRDMVETMKPWYVSLMIAQQELEQLGYKPALGVDQQLQKLAYTDSKEILQLETFQEQISLLASDPPAIQALSLKATLQELDQTQASIEALILAWQSGDADKMLELTLASGEKYPALKGQMDKLINRRNRTMTNKIKKLIDGGGNYLVVVGALHMGGNKGIIKRLRNDYRVRQL